MPDEIFDIIVIGGGPAGLSAALYGARSKLKTLILDKNPQAGALGKAKEIANYPGIPEPISGIALLDTIKKQAESFGAKFVQDQVVGVNFTTEPREVMTNKSVYNGKTVVIATGSMGRKPSIQGEEEYIGRGVSYCPTCDAPFFSGKTAAAVGPVNVMLDELETITKFVDKLYLVTKTAELTAEQDEILSGNTKLELMRSYNVKEIRGDQVVTDIIVADSEGVEKELEVSGVFMYLQGAKPIVEFLLGAVELNTEGCIKVERDMSTSVEGVYAVGDVTCKPIRQVVVATAEGCIAALSAEKYINTRKRMKSQWG
jgi:thioredoxin reductase (NADPH)